MKNQYFADENDYCKYGLLRVLAGDGRIKTAVCWMLTEADQRTDGKFVDYLDKRDEWRHYEVVCQVLCKRAGGITWPAG